MATENKKYAKPPIKEALIDIRASLPDSVTAADLLEAGKAMGDYPAVEQRRAREISFRVPEDIEQDEDPKIEFDQKVDGYRFTSEDKSRIIQFRMDGFTFNQLEPYDSWKNFKQFAEEGWLAFREATKPVLVTRLGVRYINEIQFPLEKNIVNYLNSSLPIPQGMDYPLVGFKTEIIIEKSEIGAIGRVSQATTEVGPESLTYALDVDVSISRSFELDDESIEEDLNRLRDFKNELFEISITNETRSLFK